MDEREDAGVEVGLQVVVGLHVTGVHEGHDAVGGLPVGSVDLVAADVEVVVGEESGHLADEGGRGSCRGLRVGSMRGRRFRTCGQSRRALDRCANCGCRRATGDVAGDVELGDDADAAVAGVVEDAADLILSVEQAVGALCGSLGKRLTSMRKP